MKESTHIPVLLKEVVELLRPGEKHDYADLTLGEGGHTDSLLEKGAKTVIAFDRDPDAVASYRGRGKFRDDSRLTILHANFSEIGQHVHEGSLDGVLIDLGVSTAQLLNSGRGFSFASEAPLDMRMDPTSGESLFETLENISVTDLAEQLERNTDMKKSGRLAKTILDAFRSGKIRTTTELARLFTHRKGAAHPATVPFMGLRMLVNRELEETKAGIEGALSALRPGGRLAVITFHSTEDRFVKRLLAKSAGKCVCGAMDRLMCVCPRQTTVRIILKHAQVPSRDELRRNARSRSAKLRCVEKI